MWNIINMKKEIVIHKDQKSINDEDIYVDTK
jgi:hypothetical protein